MDEQVDIIIPTYNSNMSLVYTIKSLYDSTRVKFNLIIVDGGTTDETRKIISELSKETNVTIVKDNKEGVINAFNKGIQKSLENTDTKYILLTHDDVCFVRLHQKDWLHALLNVVRERGDDGLFSVVNGGGASNADYIERFRWFGTWFLLVPKKVFLDIGLFDEAFNPGNGEDIEFCYRAHLTGKQLYVIDYWVDHHHSTEHHSDNSMDVEEVKKRNAIYFRKKYKVGEFNETNSSEHLHTG